MTTTTRSRSSTRVLLTRLHISLTRSPALLALNRAVRASVYPTAPAPPVTNSKTSVTSPWAGAVSQRPHSPLRTQRERPQVESLALFLSHSLTHSLVRSTRTRQTRRSATTPAIPTSPRPKTGRPHRRTVLQTPRPPSSIVENTALF